MQIIIFVQNWTLAGPGAGDFGGFDPQWSTATPGLYLHRLPSFSWPRTSEFPVITGCLKKSGSMF